VETKEKIIDENYKITLNNRESVSLLFKNNNVWERIGFINFELTHYIFQGKENDYCNFIYLQVSDEHQNKGLGRQMFAFLYDNLPPHIYAIIYCREKIINKVQVPKILNKYNPIIVGNYEIILNPNYK
jgi:GNAT superfamily N-acetyltransferase